MLQLGFNAEQVAKTNAERCGDACWLGAKSSTFKICSQAVYSYQKHTCKLCNQSYKRKATFMQFPMHKITYLIRIYSFDPW